MIKFITKQGQLTAYALSCGYVESKIAGFVKINLWREHSCYHVRAHDRINGRMFWESFRTIKSARRHMNHSHALLLARRKASL